MHRWQQVVLLILVPLVVVGGILVGRAVSDGDDAGLSITDASDETEFDHEFVIPPGTGERIENGETVEIVPAELTVEVGESIRIENDDTEDHVVGVFFVAAGETLTQRFNSAGELSGECSVHPSGQFTLLVEA